MDHARRPAPPRTGLALSANAVRSHAAKEARWWTQPSIRSDSGKSKSSTPSRASGAEPSLLFIICPFQHLVDFISKPAVSPPNLLPRSTSIHPTAKGQLLGLMCIRIPPSPTSRMMRAVVWGERAAGRGHATGRDAGRQGERCGASPPLPLLAWLPCLMCATPCLLLSFTHTSALFTFALWRWSVCFLSHTCSLSPPPSLFPCEGGRLLCVLCAGRGCGGAPFPPLPPFPPFPPPPDLGGDKQLRRSDLDGRCPRPEGTASLSRGVGVSPSFPPSLFLLFCFFEESFSKLSSVGCRV